jgi:ArsR family transcriptional regulator
VLLALDPEETRRRLAQAIAAGARILVPESAEDELATAAASAETVLAEHPALAAIERIAGGYRYVPEVEADRVVVIPHFEPALPLVLAQHRGARLVLYAATAERRADERLADIGRALADPKRVEILALVGRGVGRSGALVDATGLSRSTVHHHLAQLRDAGLVALEGNARAYTYVARPEAAAEIGALVAAVVGQEEK